MSDKESNTEARLVLDSTAFTGAYQNVFTRLLLDPERDRFISGIKFSHRHPGDVSEISEIFSGEDRERLPALVDDSVSGGYNDMIDEIKAVSQKFGFIGATYTLGRHVTEKSIKFVSTEINKDVEDESKKKKLLISTYPPEELPLEHSELCSLSPEEFTLKAHKQADALLEFGVIGVYGAASIVVPGRKLALGSGISFDGKPYRSNEVQKNSVDLETAISNCDKILIGHILLTGVSDNDSLDIVTGRVIENFNRIVEVVYSKLPA